MHAGSGGGGGNVPSAVSWDSVRRKLIQLCNQSNQHVFKASISCILRLQRCSSHAPRSRSPHHHAPLLMYRCMLLSASRHSPAVALHRPCLPPPPAAAAVTATQLSRRTRPAEGPPLLCRRPPAVCTPIGMQCTRPNSPAAALRQTGSSAAPPPAADTTAPLSRCTRQDEGLPQFSHCSAAGATLSGI